MTKFNSLLAKKRLNTCLKNVLFFPIIKIGIRCIQIKSQNLEKSRAFILPYLGCVYEDFNFIRPMTILASISSIRKNTGN